MESKVKVLIIGLDGVSWDLLMPMIEKKALPTMGSIVKKSCWGDLESTCPAVTYPAWQGYFTGKNPGKTGIFGFTQFDRKTKRMVFPWRRILHLKGYWDILNNKEIKCGIVNLPGTYPPNGIKGFMVSGWEWPSSQGFTYPLSLEQLLKDKFRYSPEIIGAKEVSRDTSASFIERCKQREDNGMKATIFLTQRFNPQLLHLTIYETDAVLHALWDGEHRNQELINGFFEFIDTQIKYLIESVCVDDAYIIFLSDHGMRPLKRTFSFYQWLQDNGYLVISKKRLKTIERFNAWGITKTKIKHLARRGKTDYFLRNVFRVLGLGKIKDFFVEDDKTMLYLWPHVIDWKKSTVIFNPLNTGFYINQNVLSDGKKYKKLREELIEKLSEIKEPERNEKMLSAIYRKEEAYRGAFLEDAPDVIIHFKEGFWPAHEKLGEEDKELWRTPEYFQRAHHTPRGIFCISGPGIIPNRRLSNIKIYDIAPTILHIFGIKDSFGFDGRLLQEVFEDRE